MLRLVMTWIVLGIVNHQLRERNAVLSGLLIVQSWCDSEVHAMAFRLVDGIPQCFLVLGAFNSVEENVTGIFL